MQQHRRLTEESAPAAVAQAVAELPQCPGGFEGRGIVIPGGGARYFPSAWICIKMIREVGCGLPIELWHVGDGEVDAEMRSLVEPFGVTCRDALAIPQECPVRFLKGWPLKPFAVLHSRFREVLLLDADNMPLVDPTYLFDHPEYRRTGAVFWPDDTRLPPDAPAWRLMGLAYRDEPEVESGQLLVDKQRCWRAVALVCWMNNQHADFWYQYLYGDKDTFHLAWRRLGLPYGMPQHPMLRLPETMIQRDFEGRPIFQHRHGNKWSFTSQNLRIPGFAFQDRCRQFFNELRKAWHGRPEPRYSAEGADLATSAVAARLCAKQWLLRSEGEERLISFANDGSIGAGRGPREQSWSLLVHPFQALLSIHGTDGVAWMLAAHDHGWVGQAPAEPDVVVELTPVLAEE